MRSLAETGALCSPVAVAVAVALTASVPCVRHVATYIVCTRVLQVHWLLSPGRMRVRVLASVCAVVTASLLLSLATPVRALSKRVPPPMAPSETPLTATAASCADFPGVWTGFMGTSPLYDAYQLQWRGGTYPAGSFSAVYVEGLQGWTLGQGVVSADNSTATISFDTGVTLQGKITDGCSTIMWDNNSAWRKTSALPKTVYMVAMNHLDVGYNGIDPTVGFINNVLNMYFTVYFPRAVAVAAALRARNGTERLVYTTHAWLVDLYLDCPTNFTLSGVTLACPSPADQNAFHDALLMGDVVFHSSPFNIQFGTWHA